MPRLAFPRALILALVLAVPAAGAEKVTKRDRFSLWNDCRTMGLAVENLDKAATEIVLTKEAVTVAARSRLRSARLYRADGGVPFLGVSVTIVGSAFGVEVAYSKWVKDGASGISRGAYTWIRTSVGTHGRDESYILSSVSRKVDEFIDEYLRVNDSDCRKSK